MVQTHELVQQLESLLYGFREDLLGAQGDLSQMLKTTSDRLGNLCQLLAAVPAKPVVHADAGELQEMLAERERGLVAANQHVTELEQTICDLKTEVSQLRSQEAWIIAANQDLSERLVALRNEEKNSLTALASCTEEIEQLKESLHQVKSNDTRIGDLRMELEEIRSANAALHAALETAEAQVAAIEKQQRIIIHAMSGDGATRKLGEILVVAGIIDQEQLEEALLEQQQRTNSLLGEILIEKGRVQEEEVAQSVACQLQLPLVRLHRSFVDSGTAASLGKQTCLSHKCVPLAGGGRRLVLAMANPRDAATADTVSKAVGRDIAAVVAVPSEVDSVISDIFCA
jgi:myosin heavy subunit